MALDVSLGHVITVWLYMYSCRTCSRPSSSRDPYIHISQQYICTFEMYADVQAGQSIRVIMHG